MLLSGYLFFDDVKKWTRFIKARQMGVFVTSFISKSTFCNLLNKSW